MDKDIATRMAYISRSCAGLLRHTVWLVKQQGTEEDFINYKKAMGRVLAELQTRLLDPIYAEYPDLDHKSPAFSGSSAYQLEEKYLPEDEDYPDEAGSKDRNT